MTAKKAARRAPGPTAPALVRQGVYTALGGALVAGAGLLVILVLNPPPKTPAKSGGCGCSGAATATATAQAKVYG